MFIIKKEVTFAAAHKLNLDYESKCTNLHGHEWKAYISLSAKELDKNGMVIDFTEVKRFINKNLDHKYLNEILPFNPTAENIANAVKIGTKSYVGMANKEIGLSTASTITFDATNSKLYGKWQNADETPKTYVQGPTAGDNEVVMVNIYE